MIGFGLRSSVIRSLDSIQMDAIHRVTVENLIVYRDSSPITQQFDNRFWLRLKAESKTNASVRINDHRIKILNSLQSGGVLEIGVGAGLFFNSVIDRQIWGFDILDQSIRNVIRNRYLDPENRTQVRRLVSVFCAFDVIDLVDNPDSIFSAVPDDASFLFNIPIIDKMTKLKSRKIFQPIRRNVYFSSEGLKWYLDLLGFSVEVWEREPTTIEDRLDYFVIAAKKRKKAD